MKDISAFNKIMPPTLHPTILYREAVVSSLIEAITTTLSNQTRPYKLILLQAPAGYGKTLLLADVVMRITLQCCWYFLEPLDADPTLFLKTFLASIRRCFPTFGSHLDALFSENNKHGALEYWISRLDAILTTLQMEVSEPFLLAFCNYHQVNHSLVINSLMNHLLAYLPVQGVVVIESRAIPNLELVPLIAHRQLFGLGSQRLRFTAQEVYELAHLQGRTTMSLQEAQEIESAFDGWITGILLGSDLGYSHLAFQTFSHLHADADSAPHLPPLLTYIANEIFAHETALYEFLKEISILACPTAALCNALLGITDAEQRLIYAEQQGLFLTRAESSDNQATIYRSHPALRELFQEELRSHSPERYLALHSRAAQIFLNEQAYEQAVTHALQAQEYRLAILILPEIANACIAQKGTRIVRDWLNLIPEEFLHKDPRLLLILADIHDVSGEKQQPGQLLDTVEALLRKESLEDSSPLSSTWAELYILRAKLLFSQKDIQHAQELCQKVLHTLPADQRLLHIKALQCLGVGLMLASGGIPQSIVHLQHALHLSKQQKEEAQVAVLHRQLGTAYTWQGNYILAEHYQQRAYAIWEQMDNPRGIIYSLIAIGQLKRRQGFTQEAEELLTKALSLAHNRHQFSSGEAFAFEGLGELARDLGQYTQALSYFEDSLNIARTLNDIYLLHCDLCHLASVHAFMNDVHTAQFLLTQVVLEKQEESSYEGLLYYLAQSSIFLAQSHYGQAQETLENTVLLGQQAGMTLFHIKALLNLALCFLRQGEQCKAIEVSKQVLEMNRQSDHDYTIQVEVHRFPELQALLDQAALQDKSSKGELGTDEASVKLEKDSIFQSKQDLSRLRILALGEPQVFSDEIPVTRWRMARAMELYFFLLENARPLRKEQILVALWPDAESEKIDQIFRSTIYYLRKALGKDCLEYTAGLYHLNLARVYEDRIWYDVAIFDTCYSEAKKALEQEDDEAAATAFTQMLDLYTGDYLQPFYSDWCISRRDQLRQAYIDALHHLALIYWRREDYEGSLQHWQHLISLDICFEKAHYGIMRCYWRQGKRELALRQYQRYCHILQEELQATPGAALQKLYRRILGENSS